MKSILIAAAKEDAQFKGATRSILLTLAEHATEIGVHWSDDEAREWSVKMSNEEIAAEARCSKRQAIRCVAKLKAAGWLEVISSMPTTSGQLVHVFKIGKPAADFQPTKPGAGRSSNSRAFEIEKLKARLAQLEAEEAAANPRALQRQRR